jgi:hypothetical protein
MARRRVSLDIGSIMDRAWRGIHARIREHDLERPFVPSPWNVPWFHPGASYFSSEILTDLGHVSGRDGVRVDGVGGIPFGGGGRDGGPWGV